jgi:hypothetical protein
MKRLIRKILYHYCKRIAGHNFDAWVQDPDVDFQSEVRRCRRCWKTEWRGDFGRAITHSFKKSFSSITREMYLSPSPILERIRQKNGRDKR